MMTMFMRMTAILAMVTIMLVLGALDVFDFPLRLTLCWRFEWMRPERQCTDYSTREADLVEREPEDEDVEDDARTEDNQT